MIQTLLIDRVELVTGGASVVYGSDAVAGVLKLEVPPVEWPRDYDSLGND